MKKRLDEMIDEGSGGSFIWRGWRVIGLQKRIYVGECAGSRSVGRPWKRWLESVKECLR